MSDISYKNFELTDAGGDMARVIARFSTLTEPEAYELVMDFVHGVLEDNAPKEDQSLSEVEIRKWSDR